MQRPWTKWSERPTKDIGEDIWIQQTNRGLNDMRKVCLQMYRPSMPTESRFVDVDGQERMASAPFFCPREKIQKAASLPGGFSYNAEGVVAALADCANGQ